MQINGTKIVCPSCGAQIDILSEQQKTGKLSADDKLKVLKNAGVNVDNLFSMRGAVGESCIVRVENGHIIDVPDSDPMFSKIMSSGTIPNRRLFRRWVMSQVFHMLVAPGGFSEALKRKGWFVQPTIIRCKTPTYESMVKEIFGPIVSIYVYPDDKLDETLAICDSASPYALTGAIFAQDREAIVKMERALRNSSGNFYINDKCTGAIVGQQPFGGARASGTNDKAGTTLNMIRWVSAHTVKEAFCPSSAINYPYMSER